MLPVLQALGMFINTHPELVTAIMQAVQSGASKTELLRVIRSTMVATSDEVMRAEIESLPKG